MLKYNNSFSSLSNYGKNLRKLGIEKREFIANFHGLILRGLYFLNC